MMQTIIEQVVPILMTFWPVILILAGAVIIIKNTGVRLVILLLLASIIGVYVVLGPAFFWALPGISQIKSGLWTSTETKTEGFVYTKTFDYDQGMKVGTANIDLGVCSTVIKSTNEKAASIKSTIEGLSGILTKDSDKILLTVAEKDFVKNVKNLERVTHIYLGERLTWALNVSTGASHNKLDLTNLTISSLDLELGAGSAEIIIGDRAALTDIRIEGGASSIVLTVPKDSGIMIVTQSGAATNNFETAGLTQTTDGTYINAKADQGAKQVNVTLSTGISSVKLELL
jgi:hypothetical protein